MDDDKFTMTVSMRMSIADVYLLNWQRLASEHCEMTSLLHPVSKHPNFVHVFIVPSFVYDITISYAVATWLVEKSGITIFGTGACLLPNPPIVMVAIPRRNPHSYD